MLSPNACSDKDAEQTKTNSPALFSGDLSADIVNTRPTAVTGTIVISDPDPQQNEITAQSNSSTQFGLFSINNSGNWSYTLDTQLNQVKQLTDTQPALIDNIEIYSIDGSQTSLNITISGLPAVSTQHGFTQEQGGNHVDGYIDGVPIIACSQIAETISELENAAKNLTAGDTLCLADGEYTGDFELQLDAIGTATAPITIAAEHAGKAIISKGEVSIRLGGEHIVLQGFVFRDGDSGSSIIKLENNTPCLYCRITEVSVIDMDNGEYDSSKWIEYYGQYNRIDHNWFSGKESRGALLVLPRWTDEQTFNQNGFIEDRAQIDYNYFGERPPAFGRAYADSQDNEYEGVRLGLSTTHSAPSFSVLENNVFERIQGEAEVISNKSANNIIRHNTIRESHGSIVNRHGANAIIERNFVIGDDHPFSGGIRIVDDGHQIVNNYINGARYLSSNWNGGIVLTAGDGAEDTENGYQNVENSFIGFNTIVDSVNSINFFGGKGEQAPKQIYAVNNIIADAIGPVIRTNNKALPKDSNFANNFVQGHEFADDISLTTSNTEGFADVDVNYQFGVDGIFRLLPNNPDMFADLTVDIGTFNFPTIDIDGHKRSNLTIAGADEVVIDTANISPLSSLEVGPKHYRPIPGKTYIKNIVINNYDFDTGDTSGWQDTGGNGSAIVTEDLAFSRNKSLQLSSNSAALSQQLSLEKHTNYTLSAFLRGSAKLNISVGDSTYFIERNSVSTYGFEQVSFNSEEQTQATLTAIVNDNVKNQVQLNNPNFNEEQTDWEVAEGDGIGQVQDSDNSASGSDGSIKFKYNDNDSGEPYSPYIAQTVSVTPNTLYTLSMFNLYKNDNDNSSVVFGTSSSADINDVTSWVSNKESIYSALAASNNTKGDDSFYQDTLMFSSGDNTSLTIFAQFKSTTGEEIRVDDFALSYQAKPEEGTTAYFDSIRLVSHPLSPEESNAAAEN